MSSQLLSPRRLGLALIFVFISLHFFLKDIFYDSNFVAEVTNKLGSSPAVHENVRVNITSLSGLPSVTTEPEAAPTLVVDSPPDSENNHELANATFVFLCRNDDVNGAVSSIQQMEDRFNRRYGYPWVLLNEEPFTDEFKERIQTVTTAPVSFGLIPREHWFQPDWVDEERASEGRTHMMNQGIIYAGSVPYRNMCRFNSGFFFHHELLRPYRYYWRVEPEVKFFCDLSYDPFKFMEENDKIYGFTISLVEWPQTIPTLWQNVKDFITNNSQYINPQNAMDFLSDDAGESYNLCHYWSNFEIADMDFWRGEAYQKFFNFLESTGGFYYERWGDAPIHSIAVSLFARRDQVHFFKDIGYRHDFFQHCPSGDQWRAGKCACDPKDSFDYAFNSCLKKYEALFP